jgi:hypothetical protein
MDRNEGEKLREELLISLNNMRKDLEKKIIDGRIKNPKNEEIRIRMIRAYVNLCKTYGEILEKMEITELRKQLMEVKKLYKKAIEKMEKNK